MEILDDNNQPKSPKTSMILAITLLIAAIAWVWIWFYIEWDFLMEINSATYVPGTYPPSEMLWRAARHIVPGVLFGIIGHMFYRDAKKKLQ